MAASGALTVPGAMRALAGRRLGRGASLSILAGAACFGIYVFTLAPDVVGHDAGEMQFVPYIFGIPHYTGYPLYLILGKAWSLLPVGSVAWRMNLLSALLGAVAAALTGAAAFELTERPAPGAVAGLAVGLAPLAWTWSIMAGVRSLATAFVAAALLLAVRWEHAVRDGETAKADRRLLALALVAGFGLDHHRTFALLLPILAVFVLLVQPGVARRGALLARAGGLLVLPLGLYGILPLRAALGAPWDQWNTATWSGFVTVTLAGAESSAHLDLTAAQVWERLPQLGQALLTGISPPAAALCVAGLGWCALRRKPWLVLLGGYTLALCWLTVMWNIGGALNLVYLMPAYPALAVLAAAGVAGLAGLLKWSALADAGLSAASLAAVAATGLYAGRSHFQPPPETLGDFRQNLFEGHQARRLADAMALLPHNAVIVADWDQATPLWYAQFVDGVNPGASISYPASSLPSVLSHTDRPVFLATASFRPAGPVSATGPFVQVLRRPADGLPPGTTRLGGVFGSDIELAGMAPIAQPRFGVLPVTLFWRAVRRPNADYHVSVRLMPAADRVATQRDEASPVLGLSPTSTWQPGQVTADYYELDLRTISPGSYDLAVVLYQPLPNGAFRDLAFQGGSRAILGRLSWNGRNVSFQPAGGRRAPATIKKAVSIEIEQIAPGSR